ncbi:hypothetical protein J4216_06755 [Candidatus Woesearchaeota archaeon]|nr:hypothetical protein [Candidatus Woesearchaeota archaeon]
MSLIDEVRNLLGFGEGKVMKQTKLEVLQEIDNIMEEFHDEIQTYIITLRKKASIASQVLKKRVSYEEKEAASRFFREGIPNERKEVINLLLKFIEIIQVKTNSGNIYDLLNILKNYVKNLEYPESYNAEIKQLEIIIKTYSKIKLKIEESISKEGEVIVKKNTGSK